MWPVVTKGERCGLVACPSISPCVDVVQKMANIPVLKIDEAMADKAVEMVDKRRRLLRFCNYVQRR